MLWLFQSVTRVDKRVVREKGPAFSARSLKGRFRRALLFILVLSAHPNTELKNHQSLMMDFALNNGRRLIIDV